jgi:hypothetical protein
MSLDDLDGVIAERQLTVLTENGETRNILVRVGRPERTQQHDDFSCACQIMGCHDDKVHRIYGLDAFQALQLTLKFISSTLNHYRQKANGCFYWQEPGDDMGFANLE